MKKALVVGIIVLFIGMSVIPSSGTSVVKNSTIPLSNGNTLYVGGSGPDNYTSIKEAINNASDGDTVYVYDDSSPYHEGDIVIYNSINLNGENRNTTIITVHDYYNILVIKSNYINVSEFTFKNTDSCISIIEYNNISIFNNIFINNSIAINTFWCYDLIIYNNIFTFNGDAIICSSPGDSKIEGNIFNFNELAIGIIESGSCEVSRNIISDNYAGIDCYVGFNLNIFLNDIKNNYYGIDLAAVFLSKITKNNIYNNIEEDASFLQAFLNKWIRNYWGEIEGGPKRIKGIISIFVGFDGGIPIFKDIPWSNFDWFPARKPYDVTVLHGRGIE